MLRSSDNPFPLRRQGAESWKELSITEIAPSVEIVSRAIEFRDIGFREVDPLHIACTIASNSRYFITTDDAVLKKSFLVEDISLVNPIEFLDILKKR